MSIKFKGQFKAQSGFWFAATSERDTVKEVYAELEGKRWHGQLAKMEPRNCRIIKIEREVVQEAEPYAWPVDDGKPVPLEIL